ncbi:hypothetical protein ACFLQV_02635 [Calditrichota bacterium]
MPPETTVEYSTIYVTDESNNPVEDATVYYNTWIQVGDNTFTEEEYLPTDSTGSLIIENLHQPSILWIGESGFYPLHDSAWADTTYQLSRTPWQIEHIREVTPNRALLHNGLLVKSGGRGMGALYNTKSVNFNKLYDPDDLGISHFTDAVGYQNELWIYCNDLTLSSLDVTRLNDIQVINRFTLNERIEELIGVNSSRLVVQRDLNTHPLRVFLHEDDRLTHLYDYVPEENYYHFRLIDDLLFMAGRTYLRTLDLSGRDSALTVMLLDPEVVQTNDCVLLSDTLVLLMKSISGTSVDGFQYHYEVYDISDPLHLEFVTSFTTEYRVKYFINLYNLELDAVGVRGSYYARRETLEEEFEVISFYDHTSLYAAEYPYIFGFNDIWKLVE